MNKNVPTLVLSDAKTRLQFYKDSSAFKVEYIFFLLTLFSLRMQMAQSRVREGCSGWCLPA